MFQEEVPRSASRPSAISYFISERFTGFSPCVSCSCRAWNAAAPPPAQATATTSWCWLRREVRGCRFQVCRQHWLQPGRSPFTGEVEGFSAPAAGVACMHGVVAFLFTLPFGFLGPLAAFVLGWPVRNIDNQQYLPMPYHERIQCVNTSLYRELSCIVYRS